MNKRILWTIKELLNLMNFFEEKKNQEKWWDSTTLRRFSAAYNNNKFHIIYQIHYVCTRVFLSIRDYGKCFSGFFFFVFFSRFLRENSYIHSNWLLSYVVVFHHEFDKIRIFFWYALVENRNRLNDFDKSTYTLSRVFGCLTVWSIDKHFYFLCVLCCATNLF